MRIGDRFYIGKDSRYPKRKEAHLHLLKKDSHYNKFIQKSYNKYKEVEFRPIVVFSDNVSDETMYEVEIIMIRDYKNKGIPLMNLTDGGEGGKGHKKNEFWYSVMRERMLGEKNPQSKISYLELELIYDLIDSNFKNYEIAEMFNLHPNYISLIRHGSRHKKQFEKRYGKKHKVVMSLGNKKMSYEKFIEIVELLNSKKYNYIQISKKTGIDRSVINRIALKKTYKEYWDMYESN